MKKLLLYLFMVSETLAPISNLHAISLFTRQAQAQTGLLSRVITAVTPSTLLAVPATTRIWAWLIAGGFLAYKAVMPFIAIKAIKLFPDLMDVKLPTDEERKEFDQACADAGFEGQKRPIAYMINTNKETGAGAFPWPFINMVFLEKENNSLLTFATYHELGHIKKPFFIYLEKTIDIGMPLTLYAILTKWKGGGVIRQLGLGSLSLLLTNYVLQLPRICNFLSREAERAADAFACRIITAKRPNARPLLENWRRKFSLLYFEDMALKKITHRVKDAAHPPLESRIALLEKYIVCLGGKSEAEHRAQVHQQIEQARFELERDMKILTAQWLNKTLQKSLCLLRTFDILERAGYPAPASPENIERLKTLFCTRFKEERASLSSTKGAILHIALLEKYIVCLGGKSEAEKLKEQQE